jgi:hypothetical protein
MGRLVDSDLGEKQAGCVDSLVAHVRQLWEATRGKGEWICRRDQPTTVGRKPRRFYSVRPLVILPHAPGLSHSLPAD